MKTNFTLKKWLVIGVLAGLLVALTAIFTPAQVFAQAQTAATPTPNVQATRQEKLTESLEKAYKRETELLPKQAERLTKADELIKKGQTAIDELKKNGKDTSKLEKTLEKFKNALANAHKFHDQAAAALKTHAGFNAKGKVTDVKEAGQTMKEASNAMKKCANILQKGSEELQKLIRKNNQSQRPTPTPKP